MPITYNVNLSILFTEIPLLDRPAAAAAAGFHAVELWWPFAVPSPPDADLDALQRALDDAGVQLVGLNFDAGDMAKGERGLLSRPTESDRFVTNVDVAVGFAQRLGCRTLNALYGNRDPDASPEHQDELALENLTLAAAAAEKIGATVVIEALNSYESPHYPLVSSRDALAVIDRVRTKSGLTNVSFLADFYHLHRMGEEPIELIDRAADRFGHVQLADVPGRGQPGTGTIPYEQVLQRLDASGYRGFVGLEYKPVGPSADSFDWLPFRPSTVEVSS